MDDNVPPPTDNIQVYARIRPSKDSQARVCAFAISNTTIKLDPKLGGTSQSGASGRSEEAPKTYSFDGVASPHVSQESFFEKVGRPMAEYCLSGYNGCIFAYGQTGSGKTYTIQGPDGPHNPEDKGLTVRVLEYIFRKLARLQRSSTTGFAYVCECSYLELYQENLQDLLADDHQPSNNASHNPKKLELREDLKKGVYVENMTKIQISSAEDAEGLFLCGAKKRHVASSKANDQSSRSHAVFTIYIQIQETNESGITAIKSSMLHIVDLAGSERQKNTEATGARLQEAGIINKSLTHLGKTIRALVDKSEGKNVHVPYRESKLTFLLKQSLGGNSKTSIIATIDPGAKSYGETLSTLRFADRAKMIKNNAVINEHSAGTMSQMQAELKRLQSENQALRNGFINPLSLSNINIDSNSSNGTNTLSNGTSRAIVPLNLNGILNLSPRSALIASTTSDGNTASEERICELEELLRSLIEKLKLAYADRDNFSQKIRDLQQLLVAKDYFLESSRLIAKLREEKITRIMNMKVEDLGEEFANNVALSFEEAESLHKEIKNLRFQVDHHPDIIRLSIENLELKEILEQYESYYGHNGSELNQLRSLCAKFSVQIQKLIDDKSKLLALLKQENEGSIGEGSKIDIWEQEQHVQKLEAEIERIKFEALEQLAAGEEREKALQLDLDETKLALITLQDQYVKLEEAHQEEKRNLEAHYCQLSDRVRDGYETQIRALYDRLEHAKVSSVTVLTMEKQLSAQSDEYLHLKKVHAEMESDLKSLRRILETSYQSDSLIGSEIDDRYDNGLEDDEDQMRSHENDDNFDNFDENDESIHTPTKKSKISAKKSPWNTPKTPRGSEDTVAGFNRKTPGGHIYTPGGSVSSISIPRMAISKIQELYAIVSDYKSKISELENALVEADRLQMDETRVLDEQIAEQEDKIAQLESQLSESHQREAASKEEIEELESQLDMNTQLMEEKEAETRLVQTQNVELQNQIEQLNHEKSTLSSHMETLVSQLKSQKDEQVLLMMKRQDELEQELNESKKQLELEIRKNEEISSSLAHAQDRVAKSETIVIQTRSLVDSLTNTLSEKDREVSNLKGRLKDSYAENESLNQRLEILQESEQRVQVLEEQNSDLASQCKESCRALREQVSAYKKLEESFAQELASIEKEKEIASRAFEDLQRDNDHLSYELNQLHVELKMSISKYQHKESESHQLSESHQIEKNQLMYRLETSEASLSDMRESLKEVLSQKKSLEVELSDLKNDFNELKDKLTHTETRLEFTTNELETTKAELLDCQSELMDRKESLVRIMEEGTEEQHALQSEKEELELEISKLSRDLLQSTDEVSNLKLEVFTSKEEMIAREVYLENELANKSKQVLQQESHIFALQDEINQLTHNSAVDRRRFEQSHTENIQLISQLTRQLKEASTRNEMDVREVDKQLQALTIENQSLLKEIEFLKSEEHIAAVSELVYAKHAKEIEERDLMSRNLQTQLNQTLCSKDFEIDELQAALTEAKQEIACLNAQITDLSKTSANTETALLMTKEKLADLSSHKNNKIRYVQEMKAENTELRQEIVKLKKQIHNLTESGNLSTSGTLQKTHEKKLSNSSSSSSESLVSSTKSLTNPAAAQKIEKKSSSSSESGSLSTKNSRTLLTSGQERVPTQDVTNLVNRPITRSTSSRRVEEMLH